MTTIHDSLLAQIDLAVEFTEKGQLANAEPLYISCLDTLSATLGDHHPDTISCTSNLGLLYVSQKQWNKALPWLIRCVEGKKSSLGKDHPSTLGSLTNLGIVHKNLRQYEQAEQCYHQALDGRTTQCGADAPETLTVINNLATLYSEQQQYEKAQPLLSGDMTIRDFTLTISYALLSNNTDSLTAQPLLSGDMMKRYYIAFYLLSTHHSRIIFFNWLFSFILFSIQHVWMHVEGYSAMVTVTRWPVSTILQCFTIAWER